MSSQMFFIEDRARSLAYEARRFPSTAETALAWIFRAKTWASQRGNAELAASMADIERSIALA